MNPVLLSVSWDGVINCGGVMLNVLCDVLLSGDASQGQSWITVVLRQQ